MANPRVRQARARAEASLGVRDLDGMVAQIFQKVGQGEKQLEQLGALLRRVRLGLLGERLRSKIGVGQQPIEQVGIEWPTLMAPFERRSQAQKCLLGVVIQAKAFLRQS